MMLTLKVHCGPLNSNWSEKCDSVTQFLFFPQRCLFTINFGMCSYTTFVRSKKYHYYCKLLGNISFLINCKSFATISFKYPLNIFEMFLSGEKVEGEVVRGAQGSSVKGSSHSWLSPNQEGSHFNTGGGGLCKRYYTG